MKLEREKDIPAFKNKTGREKRALRRLAEQRDSSIFVLRCLGGALVAPIFALAHWLMVRFSPYQSFLVFVAIYLAVAIPFSVLFDRLFVTPRIRKALESQENPAT